ncbi:plasmid pRiA4b ORF-3 family protein [Fredinandcohnia onubensis]|uniref:plasmid pRiA4b ORF-3 family protein n=1 Tax=Fredinandcohnia onubensis TaxID=1571209 RepID=UPI000C0C0C9F|nr:plasmid pRiA4b ORF-3 family protein [Fredinandcohnia onubensis]
MYKKEVRIRITDEYPTPIIGDFIRFLDYIANNKIKLTKANEFLPRKDLIAIYDLMSHPKFDVPLKNNQPGYPLLHLFFLASIELDLLRKEPLHSQKTVTLQSKRYEEFLRLTTSEQYIALLEAFWMKVDWDYLQGGYFERAPHSIDILFDKLEDYPANKIIYINKNDILRRLFFDFENFLYYFHYFGFWEVVFDEEKTKKVSPTYRAAKSILLTPLFKQLQESLLDTCDSESNEEFGSRSFLDILGLSSIYHQGRDSEEPERMQHESLFPLLQPLFEEGEVTQNFLESEIKNSSGTYLFKVTLNQSCWRKLQFSASHTLLDVHHLIQEAFDFEDDHLYAFFMDGKKFSRKNFYNSPIDFEGPYANEVNLGELQLREGKSFLYLFDFGDEWEFYIDVLKIIEGKSKTKARIVDRKGEAPAQYGWEEV